MLRFNLRVVEFDKADTGVELKVVKPNNKKWNAVKVNDEVYMTRGFPQLFDKDRVRIGLVIQKFDIGNDLVFVLKKK